MVYVIYQAKISNICWFHGLKREISGFSLLYFISKLNICELWIIGQIEQALCRCYRGLYRHTVTLKKQTKQTQWNNQKHDETDLKQHTKTLTFDLFVDCQSDICTTLQYCETGFLISEDLTDSWRLISRMEKYPLTVGECVCVCTCSHWP